MLWNVLDFHKYSNFQSHKIQSQLMFDVIADFSVFCSDCCGFLPVWFEFVVCL